MMIRLPPLTVCVPVILKVPVSVLREIVLNVLVPLTDWPPAVVKQLAAPTVQVLDVFIPVMYIVPKREPLAPISRALCGLIVADSWMKFAPIPFRTKDMSATPPISFTLRWFPRISMVLSSDHVEVKAVVVPRWKSRP